MIESAKTWLSKGTGLRSKIKRVQEGLDDGSIQIEVDESRIVFENLEELSEVELYALREKYQPPVKEMVALGSFSVAYFSFTTWLTMKYGRQTIKKMVPAHRRNFGTIVIKGTLLAGSACGFYGLLAYGLMQQLDIFTKYRFRNAINKQMIKTYLREDKDLQDYNLIENMRYYEMPQDMIDKAQVILDTRREKLKNEKAMLIYLIDDEEEPVV